MAGYSAAVKLNNLVITSFTTLGNGISNYTAQNVGAEQAGPGEGGLRRGPRSWCGCCSVPLVVLYFFAGRSILLFFISQPTATAIQTGVTFLRILSPFYFIISAKLVADGILRGAGMMEQVHDRHLCRPDSACDSGDRAGQNGDGRHRHLVRLAGGLVHGCGAVHRVLPHRCLEKRPGAGDGSRLMGEGFMV